ncbi:MAG: hypothetical protein F4Z78_09435 [Gammaproteobacteria bacterium]|nr:hypothetical protein [Gammaproteobacteria bacterium]
MPDRRPVAERDAAGGAGAVPGAAAPHARPDLRLPADEAGPHAAGASRALDPPAGHPDSLRQAHRGHGAGGADGGA